MELTALLHLTNPHLQQWFVTLSYKLTINHIRNSMGNESGFNEYFISCTSIDKIYLSSNHFFIFCIDRVFLMVVLNI